jgi:DNA-binding SARP family transcriptional activator
MMPTLRIHLFGKFCVLCDELVLDGFNAHKVQELFCYLLLYRDRSLPRELLASHLWPETTTTQSKKNLRQTLWRLQSALDSFNERANDRVLIVEPDWVQLNSEADLWLDVSVFERAYNVVQKTSGQELDSSSIKLLQETVHLYQGPLLEGWYQDWCLQERERFQGMYLDMLEKLMSYCEVHHDYETSLSYGKQIMCYDRARERTHRRMMRLYYLIGDREEALRQYERCAVALNEELGLPPAKSTIAIYRQIQADQLEALTPTPVGVDTSPEAPVSPLLEILCHLSRLQNSLSDLQNEVHQSVQMIQLILSDNQ